MQIHWDKTKLKGGRGGECSAWLSPHVILPSCYFQFHSESLLYPLLPSCQFHVPLFSFKYSVVVYKKHLIILETHQWNAAYCSTAALSKIITAVGNNNLCLLVQFSGDVGCVLRPHGTAIVAGCRLPSGAGTKTKKLFFPRPYTEQLSWQIHWFPTQ